MKQLLLLSGGIDSIALAYWRRPAVALSVDYGQRAARKEIDAARYVTQQLKIEHHILRADLESLGCGTMVGREPTVDAPTPEWWPFRNQLLLTIGAMLAVKCNADTLLIGTVASDNPHSDGRACFIDQCRQLLACQERGIDIEAPALKLSSAELVKRSGVPHSLLACAHSCHAGDVPCGNCRGCFKHSEVFADIGLL